LDYYQRTEAERRGRRVCAMVDDGAQGESALEGVGYAATALGFEFLETARFRPGDEDFTAQIRQLKDGGCAAVVLASIPPDTSGILSAAAQAGFRPRWLGLAPTWAPALAHSPLSGYLQDNFWLVRQGAQYGDRSVPGMATLLARIERHPPTVEVAEGDPRLINGYVQAQVITAVLEQAAKDRNLSAQGVLSAVTHVGTLSFDGLIGDYHYGSIDERGPERQSSIFRVDPGQPFGATPLEENLTSAAADRFEPEPAR
jgi:ABC-type branched-subunit amino acid transport system substrate-binding protein